MQETITLTLLKQVKQALDDATRREGISRDDLISKALKQYLFVHPFRSLRERMTRQAQAQGIYSDEDVFDQRDGRDGDGRRCSARFHHGLLCGVTAVLPGWKHR